MLSTGKSCASVSSENAAPPPHLGVKSPRHDPELHVDRIVTHGVERCGDDATDVTGVAVHDNLPVGRQHFEALALGDLAPGNVDGAGDVTDGVVIGRAHAEDHRIVSRVHLQVVEQRVRRDRRLLVAVDVRIQAGLNHLEFGSAAQPDHAVVVDAANHEGDHSQSEK